MKDVVKQAPAPYKKVIARQVEKVYPTRSTNGMAPAVVALEERVKALETENSQLKAEARRLTAIERQNGRLAAEMEALEKSVAVSNRQKSVTSQTVTLAY
jgi:hypothetical protein